jgi:hypothetical protein
MIFWRDCDGGGEEGGTWFIPILGLGSRDSCVRCVTANLTGDIARMNLRKRYALRAAGFSAGFKPRPSVMVERAAMLASEGPRKQQILRCIPRRSKSERGKKARDFAQDDRVRV